MHANHLLTEFLSTSETNPQDTLREKVDVLLGRIQYVRWSDYPKLIDLAREALEYAKMIHYVEGVVRSLNALAWGYNRQHEYLKAITPASEGLALARAHSLRVEEGYALCNMAACYGHMGDYDQALEVLQQQRIIAEQEGNRELLIFALHDIGGLYGLRGEQSRAQDYLERVLDQPIDTLSINILTITKQNLAYVLLRQGQIEEARQFAETGLDEAYQSGFVDGYIRLLMVLSEIARLQKQNDRALDYLRQALAKQRATGGNAALQLSYLGHLHHEQGRNEQALRTLREALSEAQRAQRKPIIADVYKKLAQVYEAQADYKSALEQERLHQQMKETIFNEKSEQRFQMLEVVHRVQIIEAQFQKTDKGAAAQA